MREKMSSPEIYEGDSGLEHMNEFQGARKEALLIATERMAEEVIENNIKNVIFIDNSARPAATALKEYWKIKLPDEEMPGLFFVNPAGFKTEQDIANQIDTAIKRGSASPSLRYLSYESARDGDVISEEFKKRYGKLMAEKDQPTMLFDTCAHSGTTLKPIIRTLTELGFDKLLVGLASAHACDINPDIVLVNKLDCRPFGFDESVLKHQGNVESLRRGGYEGQSEDDLLRRDRAQLLRENIKTAIHQKFDAASSPTTQQSTGPEGLRESAT